MSKPVLHTRTVTADKDEHTTSTRDEKKKTTTRSGRMLPPAVLQPAAMSMKRMAPCCNAMQQLAVRVSPSSLRGAVKWSSQRQSRQAARCAAKRSGRLHLRSPPSPLNPLDPHAHKKPRDRTSPARYSTLAYKPFRVQEYAHFPRPMLLLALRTTLAPALRESQPSTQTNICRWCRTVSYSDRSSELCRR